MSETSKHHYTEVFFWGGWGGVGRGGLQVFKTISQHDCLSGFMITATPSVVLKNVSGLHVSSRLAADVTKLKL